jgi:hypothetical protein
LAAGAPAACADFGFKPAAEGFSSQPLREGDSPDQRAGAHPAALRTEVNFNLGPELPSEPGVPVTDGDVRDLEIELPPGLVENPASAPKCSQAKFHIPRGETPFEASLSGESCPPESQVGLVEIRSSYGGGSARTFGLFNLEPPPGAPSELGFNPYGAPVTFIPEVRQQEGEYGLTLLARNIPQAVDVYGLTLEVWGTPSSIIHNSQRGTCLNEAEPTFGWAKCLANPGNAYLTLPTSCEGPLAFKAKATSWQEPGSQVQSTYEAPGPEGCENLIFEPLAAAAVTDPRASSASGYDFDLFVNNEGFLNPKFKAPSPIRKAVVSLPQGMTINPSVGAGLGSCSPAQYEAETASSPMGAGCPNQAKIGDFTVKTPLFEEGVEGSLYLASPHQNPFGSLLAVYLIAKAPDRGIVVKVAGRLDPDQTTGTLTATFDRLPQLPYTDLKVHFREGQRSPLATPAACGAFASQIDLSPWNNPGRIRHSASNFQIAAGVDGGPCPFGTPPFAPKVSGGTLNSRAGAYTPFYLHLTRTDTQQEFTSYSATLPPGLLGKIGAIPYCSEADLQRAARNSGVAEAEHPSCPPASEIGHTIAGYGLGQVLTYAPGKLYLAGPFHGSDFSVVAVDSATVGPFDLGVVIVRSAIKVDPTTAQVSIDSEGSDPIPHIIDGIPIHLKDIRVYISRPNLTLNPTSCDPFLLSSTMKGSGASFGDSADDQSATSTAPFQAFNCAALGFRPKLSLRLKGGTKRGDYPKLRVEVKPRAGDANIASAQVALPPSEFLAQNHIETICTKAQFAREACPPGSVYGHARAFTPLLDQPLEGNVYLRSSNTTLPDLVIALRGGGKGIKIDLAGKIDSFKGGLRGTFNTIPDAPVSKFVMTLRGGKHGTIQNSEDVCAATGQSTLRFSAHNRLGLKGHLGMEVPCGKGSKGKSKQKGRGR